MTCVVGVDLRSSKICELGLLNYKAKHVFYPSEKRRFRCRDDYYWASIFQVIIAFYTWLSSLWVAVLYVKFRKDHGFSWFHIVNHMWLGLAEISRTLLDSYIVRLSIIFFVWIQIWDMVSHNLWFRSWSMHMLNMWNSSKQDLMWAIGEMLICY